MKPGTVARLSAEAAKVAEQLQQLHEPNNILRNCKPDNLPGKLGLSESQTRQHLQELTDAGVMMPRNTSGSFYIMNPAIYEAEYKEGAAELWREWLELGEKTARSLQMKLDRTGQLEPDEWPELLRAKRVAGHPEKLHERSF